MALSLRRSTIPTAAANMPAALTGRSWLGYGTERSLQTRAYDRLDVFEYIEDYNR